MADNRIGSAYVQVVVKGMESVQNDLAKVRDRLQATAGYADGLRKALSETPLSLQLNIDNKAKGVVAYLQKEIADLPKEKKIAFVAEKIKAVQDEIERLQDKLKKTPNNKTIQAKLAVANNIKADLDKALKDVKAPTMKAPAIDLSGVTKSLEAIGSIAMKSFGVATAGITSFVRAADPRAWNLFQGSLGQLSVQLGSIFLPILDKVTAVVQVMTNYLRGLSNEQKDQIVKWVEMGLAIAAGIAIASKIIPVIRGIGAALGLATGGIVPLLGLLATLVIGLVGVSGASSGLGGIFDKLKEVFSAFLPILTTIGQAFLDAFQKVLPALQPVFDALTSGASALAKTLGAMFASLVPVIGLAVNTIGGIIGKVAPLFETVIQIVVPILGRLGQAFSFVVASILPTLSTLADTVVKVVGIIVDIFDEWFNFVADIVNDLMNSIGELGPFFVGIFQAMGETAKIFGNVVVGIFNGIKWAISAVIKTLIYLKTILTEVMNGNFSGAMGKANEAVEEYDRKIKEREAERKERASQRGESGWGWGKKRKRRLAGIHRWRRIKAELIGIVDAWKKVQTSAAQTPEQMKEEERNRTTQDALNEQRKTNEWLKKIAGQESMAEPSGMGV